MRQIPLHQAASWHQAQCASLFTPGHVPCFFAPGPVRQSLCIRLSAPACLHQAMYSASLHQAMYHAYFHQALCASFFAPGPVRHLPLHQALYPACLHQAQCASPCALAHEYPKTIHKRPANQTERGMGVHPGVYGYMKTHHMQHPTTSPYTCQQERHVT